MPFPWITQRDLERRLGPTKVRRIYDDLRVGQADVDAVAQLLLDACSFVGGAMAPQYSIDTISAMSPPLPEIVRITLDVATVYAAQRHPEIVRRDWEPLLKAVEREVKRIRTGEADLGTSGPPEPSQVGGAGGAVVIEGQDQRVSQTYSFTHNGFGRF